MPDNRKVPSNVLSTSSNASADNLEEPMRHLKIQNHVHQDEVFAHESPYPDRPGEPDCIYYLRTGLCGYGSKCRFNHPADGGQAALYRGELPERVGHPDCQYYLKTGTCRFGATCKYHHPRAQNDVGPIQLNDLGLPMRQDERSCPFYMRTGSCKFGVACKFHHPQPAELGAIPVTSPATYGSSASFSGLPYLGGLPTWSLPKTPHISDPRMQGPQAYMPVILSASHGFLPAQGWSTYTGTMSPLSTTNVLEDPGSFPTSAPHYPERPDLPECHYYMKTGNCKFGNTCKFHHPKERISSSAISTLGPFGLPLRPGQAICIDYNLYGICRYGPNCKYDHPLTGYYNYGVSLPTLSIPATPVYSHQRNSPLVKSSENFRSKSLSLPDTAIKSETSSTKYQTPEKKISENLLQQDNSPTHSLPNSSELPQDQSD